MATQPISMNIIKQVLIRLSQKESIRSIASALHISKNTVSRYKSIAEADPLTTRELIALEDTVLNHRFNGGSPAYCDERMEVLKELLPGFGERTEKTACHIAAVMGGIPQRSPRRLQPVAVPLSHIPAYESGHSLDVTARPVSAGTEDAD